MTPLILTVDDFGMHPGIDAAVLELGAAGYVTATSCLVLSPRWQEAARALTPAVRQQLDVGLHVDFTEFGRARPLNRLICLSMLRRLDPATVRRRIVMQLDAFEDALGTPPDYIDGHQHAHQLPRIRDALIDEVQQRYGAKPWIRISNPPPGHGLKGIVIRELGASPLARKVTAAGLRQTTRLLGTYDFDLSEAEYKTRLEHWLSIARPRDALMLHIASSVPTTDPIGPARLIEYQVLRSPWFASALQSHSIHPARGREALS